MIKNSPTSKKKFLTLLSKIKTKILVAWSKIASTYGKTISGVIKRNAFAPYGMFALIAFIPLTILALVITDIYIRYVIVGIFLLLIIFACIMYYLLFKKDPSLLQTEEFRLEQQKLNMIAEKGGEIRIGEVDLNQNVRIGGGESHE